MKKKTCIFDQFHSYYIENSIFFPKASIQSCIQVHLSKTFKIQLLSAEYYVNKCLSSNHATITGKNVIKNDVNPF